MNKKSGRNFYLNAASIDEDDRYIIDEDGYIMNEDRRIMDEDGYISDRVLPLTCLYLQRRQKTGLVDFAFRSRKWHRPFLCPPFDVVIASLFPHFTVNALLSQSI